jgi:pimeloyl-ACP methyl ester carboxylesterase
MLQERIFKTGDLPLNYGEGPNTGPPMVFLHGLSARWQSFQDLALRYSERWHVFALDLRGHGGSGRVAGSYTWETFGEDTGTFLREVVREPAVILGHSIGAMLAIYQAARSPGLVRAIILEDPPLFRYRRVLDASNEVELAATLEIARRRLPPEGIRAALAALDPRCAGPALESRVASLSQLDPEALAMTVDASGTRSFEIEALLPGVGCPALLLYGSPERGSAITAEDLAAAQKLAPGLRTVSMPEVGHLMHARQPDAFCAHVDGFLGSL